jgi:hypothetical protein
METPLKHPPPGKGQGQMVWKHEQLRLPPADAEQERRYCWGSNKKITTQAARVALAIACGDTVLQRCEGLSRSRRRSTLAS